VAHPRREQRERQRTRGEQAQRTAGEPGTDDPQQRRVDDASLNAIELR
jgi:hypothetical protein